MERSYLSDSKKGVNQEVLSVILNDEKLLTKNNNLEIKYMIIKRNIFLQKFFKKYLVMVEFSTPLSPCYTFLC